MAKRNETGKDGESVARAFLEKQGYRITHTNWHWHHYELDIVAVKDTWLIVVEVKTRSEDYLLAPEEAVDAPKIRRIVAAADAYVRFFNLELPVRFDIITVSLLTEFAKAAEILTHLRGGQSQPLCQNGRGNADTFFMIQFVNAAIISRHPGNHGI